MMLVITTQIHENYGAHDWNGEGECPQYWKAKGGHEYKITNIPLNIDYAEVVAMAKVETDDNYFRESIIDWSVEADDYLSWYEKTQLEFDGEINYPEPEFEYNELIGEHV